MMSEKTELLKPNELLKKIQKGDDSLCIIDVRSEDEFDSGTLEGAQCIPYEKIGSSSHALPRDKDIVLLCQSGNRSAKAKDQLLKQFDFDNVYELEGGIKAWKEAKHPIVKKKFSIPVQRQVLILAGLIVLTMNILGFLVYEWFYAVAAFVGAGLALAGLTGFCGMAMLLEKMPWNKAKSCN